MPLKQKNTLSVSPPANLSQSNANVASLQVEKPQNSEVKEPEEEKEEAEPDRSNLKAYLDQCSGEFTYLMVSPSNLPPPRESPPQQTNLNLGDMGQSQAQTQEALEAIYL